MESLLQDLGSVLCLAAVALETFSGSAATALSSFGVAFLIGCSISHGVWLQILLLPRGVLCGSLGPQTGCPNGQALSGRCPADT